MSHGKHKTKISHAERELFRREIGDIQRLSRPDKHSPLQRLPSARPRLREADEADVLQHLLDDGPEELETGDELYYRQPGVQLAVMRRLKRGHYRCQAELDLHGMVVASARQAVAEFLQQASDRDQRCVRIVHGKGLRSGNRGPVLKTKLAHWLRQRREVLAYSSARQVDGGTGAVYVLLRKAG